MPSGLASATDRPSVGRVAVRRKKLPVDWPAVAQALAGKFPRAALHPRVLAWLDARPTGTRVAVAFSGGADSLAALLLLWAHWPERRGELLALHFNHRLRGAPAAADARFCRQACRRLGVDFRAGAATWRTGSKVGEAEAREARFAFFAEAMREVRATAIVLGHQRDDVVETVLLRLARGAGLRGLAAPRPVQAMRDGTMRLRPLLIVPKAELLAALKRAGASWCYDATNHGDAYFRNRLRRAVIPAWTAAAPADLAAAVARSREQLEEDDAALEAWVDRVVPATECEGWPVAGWRELPPAVVRRGLYRWLIARGLGADFSGVALEPAVAALSQGVDARVSAGAAGFLVVERGSLRLDPLPAGAAAPWLAASAELQLPGEWAGPDGARLVATLCRIGRGADPLAGMKSADGVRAVFLGYPVQPPSALGVRTWQPGDRYRPFGSNHVSKLQDQFVNRRVPRPERHRLPVVCDPAGSILWVPGLPPSETVRVTAASRWLVQLTYHPAHPRSHPQDVR